MIIDNCFLSCLDIFNTNMKIGLLIFILVGALFIFESCGDDDSGPTGLALEGTLWTQISFDYANCDNPDNNGSGTLVCTAQNCITALFENGTVTYTEIEDGVSSTITLPVTITSTSFSAFGQTATYQIVGNTLTANSEFDGCTLVEVYTGTE